ncbi:Bacteriophage head-to-tail connecting protein [Candidatus Terasakiella magnetica]|uniref:Bacteriophage head-to-tail connecting protein n=1 Tax=Candidatus Terasakiella magnetica TaxID=1867952 RepID=A0A1C3RDQ2_9PROT|nr:Bacteriophage head-to-tail connecting protein [Candidatus Terasakiella magnetica]
MDQLAASMLAHLTPPWARWFGLTAGPDVEEGEIESLNQDLDKASAMLQTHFERSNFSIEMHQCFLDLVTVGSACLLFEEAPPGEASAFRFTAVPLSQVMMEEGVNGMLSDTFRRSEMSLDHLRARFAESKLPHDMVARAEKNKDELFSVVEAVIENGPRFEYMAVLEHGHGGLGEPTLLRRGVFSHSPFIGFRWLKAPGESYGRSPVMKALPDIKTANKVVELALKNASIAVTGIWQADDDGVLNPATIKLVPGTIIPKAVGSAGLTPLQSPGSFDLSQVVLEELRKRIRHALLADKLGATESKQMTATEVLERSAEMARILGATYGRLQAELLTPLVVRALAVLNRRGEINGLRIDGRYIDLQYKSPLARQQTRKEAQDILAWIQSLNSLGPEAMGLIDPLKAARFLAKAYGVPGEILRSEEDMQQAGQGQLPGMPANMDMGQIGEMAQELMQNPEQMQEMMKELNNVQQQ